MKNKKKKGFTLIELLAIIVILAIIAVITVPIILNVIENSKKGAATDSAYGYKDAVNEYYMTKSLIDTDYSIPNGEYNIDPQTGYLVGTETLAIQISGLKPTGGSLELEKNKIKQGCLVIGEYEISFVNGNISETKKGNCMPTMEEMCPRCVFTTNNIDDDKYIGIDMITNYETDYNNVNSPVFMGYILNEYTNVIERAFVCSSNDGVPFCIEGSDNTAIIEKNIRNLNAIMKSQARTVNIHYASVNYYYYSWGEFPGLNVTLSPNGNIDVSNANAVSNANDAGICAVYPNEGRTGCYSN